MIESLVQLRVVIDLLLAGGTCGIAVALMKGGLSKKSLKRLALLEGSLKRMIHEAERSSQSLHENLNEQRKELERLLVRVSEGEHRLNSSIDTFHGQVDLVRGEVTLAKEVVDALQNAVVAAKTHLGKLVHANSTTKGSTADSSLSPYQRDKVSIQTAHLSAQAPPEIPFPTRRAPSFAQREEIRAETFVSQVTPPKKPTRRLSNSIEKITISPDSSTMRSDTFGQVVQRAEALLRGGASSHQTSQMTGLPLEQVEFLAAIAKDESVNARRDDPRLGILGGR
jgi:hypothetical protein